MPEPPSILFIAPGNAGGEFGNFGDPNLVGLASFVQARTGAAVEIVDLDYERLLPSPDVERIFGRSFRVVGISCYSSYDYLTAFALGQEVRRRNPDTVLVAGGYHASARPGDFLNLQGSPLEEQSPFDHVVVGEGEAPFTRIVEAALRGERVPEPVLGPEPVTNLDDLPPNDWSLLDRYRPVASTIGQQVTLYFSRGCPFGCSFCMERSKGETAWRAWSPDRAERELLAFDAWLGLSGRKLFISDAVFGLDRAWRREILERLARLDLGLAKIWLLTRVDLIDPDDVARYHRANAGVGLGLESGDPGMLALMNKAADAASFHERFRDFAARAGAAGLPWGANMIAGHPGETAESLERSARFTADLFLNTDRLTGFLAVDPFRLYPGSLVDRQLDSYAERFGTRVHRPRWWNYSEQAFTSEWVDPSSDLDYRRREALTARLFEPIVDGIAERFAYDGPAADYFRRSVSHAQTDLSPGRRLRMLASYHLWQRLTGNASFRLAEDMDATPLFRRARAESLAGIEQSWEDIIRPDLREAVLEEPRERYVPDEHAADSWRDAAVPLMDDDSSTLSAIHAYLTNYTLLDLREGDHLLEVGSGTGYGAALAARIVGETGSVVTFEIVPGLAVKARANLARWPNVTVLCADALAETELPRFSKAVFTCAVDAVPERYLEALPEGGRLVAPLTKGEDEEQELTLYARVGGRLVISRHGAVRYVQGATSEGG